MRQLTLAGVHGVRIAAGMCALVVVMHSTPAHAQLGGLGRVLDRAESAKQTLDDLTLSDEEALELGARVSLNIRTRFGVVQDAEVHRYVTLVGTTLLREVDVPGVTWTFIVLDTDGVNAFAAPGGFVHITRGALGLIRNEAELAGVLAHEIAHVTRRHTITAIQKNHTVQRAAGGTRSGRDALLARLATSAYEDVLENSFSRDDELDADRQAAALAERAGYAPGELGTFLTRLADRNRDHTARNGLFASHPDTRQRIEQITQQTARTTVRARVEARYAARINYEAADLLTIAPGVEAAAGLSGAGATGKGTAPQGQAQSQGSTAKKKGFGLSALRGAVSRETTSTQVAASGGARGVGADRTARGGDNPTLVSVEVSREDVAEFARGIS